jgi:hypothetical protein
MVLGRGPCSDTTSRTERPGIGLLCWWSKAIATDLSRSETGEDTEAEMDDRNSGHSRTGEAN